MNTQILSYLIFLIHLPHFLTRLLKVNCSCRCITLELRKALRVMCYACCLGAKPFPGLSPRQGRPKTEISHQRTNFRKSEHFLVSCPDLFFSRDFSKTHRRTQRHHSWIAFDFVEVGKLLRSELNTQILRYLHFSHPFTPIFDSPSETQLLVPLYYSRT